MAAKKKLVDEKAERELTCKLNQKDLLERGDEMAGCEIAIEKLNAKMDPLKKKKKEHEKRRAVLAKAIDDGEESRTVNCQWSSDYKKNLRELKRLDTGEVVEKRALTSEERQASLDIVK